MECKKMQPRVIVTLQENEYQALLDIAQREYRPIRLQAELIFRDALIQHGIIQASEPVRTIPQEATAKRKRYSLTAKSKTASLAVT
jgi:hypothetical protein